MDDVKTQRGKKSSEEEEVSELLVNQTNGANTTTNELICLLGRFLMEKPVNNNAMKNTLMMLWRLIKGIKYGF